MNLYIEFYHVPNPAGGTLQFGSEQLLISSTNEQGPTPWRTQKVPITEYRTTHQPDIVPSTSACHRLGWVDQLSGEYPHGHHPNHIVFDLDHLALDRSEMVLDDGGSWMDAAEMCLEAASEVHRWSQ